MKLKSSVAKCLNPLTLGEFVLNVWDYSGKSSVQIYLHLDLYTTTHKHTHTHTNTHTHQIHHYQFSG